jgi:hypothetical protein
MREALVELQVGSGRMIPVARETLVDLTLGQRALKIWVFVADITDEFILGLDILQVEYCSENVSYNGCTENTFHTVSSF